MEERAIRERWPLPEPVRVAILKRLVGYLDVETVEGSQAEPRTVLTAAKTLLFADKLNLEERKLGLAEEAQRAKQQAEAGSVDDDYEIDLSAEG